MQLSYAQALPCRRSIDRQEGERNRMKAAVYHGPLDVRIEEVPEPGPLGADEVLLAPLVGSLCGTDVTEFVAGPKMIPLHQAHPVSGHQGPVILGHEFVGIVQAVGSAV